MAGRGETTGENGTNGIDEQANSEDSTPQEMGLKEKEVTEEEGALPRPDEPSVNLIKAIDDDDDELREEEYHQVMLAYCQDTCSRASVVLSEHCSVCSKYSAARLGEFMNHPGAFINSSFWSS